MTSHERRAGSEERASGSCDLPHTPSFIRYVERHELLRSTNDRAIELAAAADVELPALVVARRQTAGRGRGGHTWWSADGALTFSLLLDTREFGIAARDWPRLSLTVAVAVCDAIQAESQEQEAGSREQGANDEFPNDENRMKETRHSSFVLRHSPLPASCSIKWPNDVLVDGRKVCGILIESPGGTAPAKDRLVVGVGINVNNSWRDAPAELAETGCALCDVTGKQHNLEGLLAGLLAAFEQRLNQLAANDPALRQAWQQLCQRHAERHEI